MYNFSNKSNALHIHPCHCCGHLHWVKPLASFHMTDRAKVPENIPFRFETSAWRCNYRVFCWELKQFHGIKSFHMSYLSSLPHKHRFWTNVTLSDQFRKESIHCAIHSTNVQRSTSADAKSKLTRVCCCSILGLKFFANSRENVVKQRIFNRCHMERVTQSKNLSKNV